MSTFRTAYVVAMTSALLWATSPAGAQEWHPPAPAEQRFGQEDGAVGGDGFQPRVEAVGDPDMAYIDPEIESVYRRMVFQDAGWRVWIGHLDGKTGSFKTRTGCDLLVVEDAATIRESLNGPEFGLDSSGWSVFFTKRDGNGVMQMWRALLEDSGPQLEQLTHLPAGAAGALVTQNAALDRTWFGFLQGKGPGLRALSAHTLAPDEAILTPDYQIGNGGARFVPDSEDVVYIRRNHESGRNEIVRWTLGTTRVEVLVSEPGVRRYYDAWIFPAAELGGEETLVATTDRTTVVFYRKPGASQPAGWQRVAEVSPPAGFPHRFIYSMEPILGIEDKVDRSWIFFEARAADVRGSETENSVWVSSPGIGGREPILRRVDDGGVTGVAARRAEPETLVGDNEVFLYYTFRSAADRRGGLRLARTGISWAQDTGVPADSEHGGGRQKTTEAVATDPRGQVSW